MPVQIKSKRRSLTDLLARRLGITQPRHVLFDHLPKCGGSTVTRYLARQYPAELIFQLEGRRPHESVREFKALPQDERFRFRLVAGHLAHDLIDHVHPDTILATILRDPIERIISHYYYVLRDKGHYLHRQVVDEGIDLKTYVSTEISGELKNWYTSHFAGIRWFEVDQDPEGALRQALESVSQRYQIIAFLDDLPRSMNRLRHLARFNSRFKNEKFNRTTDRPSREVVDPEIIDIIRRRNALDIELCERLKAHVRGERLLRS